MCIEVPSSEIFPDKQFGCHCDFKKRSHLASACRNKKCLIHHSTMREFQDLWQAKHFTQAYYTVLNTV